MAGHSASVALMDQTGFSTKAENGSRLHRCTPRCNKATKLLKLLTSAHYQQAKRHIGPSACESVFTKRARRAWSRMYVKVEFPRAQRCSPHTVAPIAELLILASALSKVQLMRQAPGVVRKLYLRCRISRGCAEATISYHANVTRLSIFGFRAHLYTTASISCTPIALEVCHSSSSTR